MKRLPFALTTLRLLLGPLMLFCALGRFARWVYVPMLVAGTLSDIFDGIAARRLGVATHWLRRYDSVTDIIYYLFVLAALWIVRKGVILANWLPIAILVASEAASLLVSFARFQKYPATHSYLAKFYGLCLLGAVISLFVLNAPGWCVVALLIVALVTNAEIIAIHLLSKTPPVDVRSVFPLLRQKLLQEP